MKRYVVKEAFVTLQGEGEHAGRVVALVRFAGCNVWSGLEGDRVRDSAKGVCAAFCDTDFVGTDGENGGRYTARELVELLDSIWPEEVGSHPEGEEPKRIALLTGGEPSLQVDVALTSRLRGTWFVHVETNGYAELPAVDFVTLSPKPPVVPVRQHYDSVKVLYPAGADPGPYFSYAPRSAWIQPVSHGLNVTDEAAAAVAYVMEHRHWRLSLQQHKLLRVR